MKRPLITVNALLAQVRERGEITLPDDALITPAARDWLHGAKVAIRRVGKARSKSDKPTTYLVGDAANPVLQTLLPGLQRQRPTLRFHPCQGHLAGLLDALKTMCHGLAECARRRGVVLVRDGGISSAFVNKFADVRAAIVDKPSVLFGAMRGLGANVIICETERVSLRQLQALLDEFLGGKIETDPRLTAALGGMAAPASSAAANCGCGD